MKYIMIRKPVCEQINILNILQIRDKNERT